MNTDQRPTGCRYPQECNQNREKLCRACAAAHVQNLIRESV